MFEFLNKLNKNHILMILVLVSLFGLLTYFIYNYYLKNYVDKKYVSNTEFIDEEALNEGSREMKVADFYYFYTKWCPHCKTATPIVNELKTQIQDNNNNFNGVYINFIDVDCEKDTKIADKFSIEGYPTIKLVYNSKVIEYDAKPNLKTLNEFLNSVLV
jgi:thiol-disulfide isomerase/thioredoxin